jgi:hypothetical protein
MMVVSSVAVVISSNSCHKSLQVRAMLPRVDNVDAIIQAVPYLTDPKELGMALANLAAWFPGQVGRSRGGQLQFNIAAINNCLPLLGMDRFASTA